MTFSDLGLGAETLRAVQDAGYEVPTPIQTQAIPHILQGRDVLGCAQTGTGKTASFALPMIDILAAGRAKARMPRSLILSPTRELAAQIAENFEIYGKYHRLTMALLIGGVSFGDQERLLDRGVDVLIATPGRLMDHFDRGRILLNDVKILVIDEADRMLDMGFMPDVERIVSVLPRIRQTLFFSATMPPEIRRLADAFLSNPREITVAPPASPAATVDQAIATVSPEEKREALRRLIRAENSPTALVFCNRKRDVDVLTRSLKKHGFSAACLHGDMSQPARTETLEAFKRGEINLLVATDVAGRGIDIDDLPCVFNFDVPHQAENYVHRIGRTGRAGRKGRALMLAAPDDGPFVAEIEKLIGRPIARIEIPGIEQAELEMEPRRGRRGRGPRATPRSESTPGPRSETTSGPQGEAPAGMRRGRRRERPAPRQEPEAIAAAKPAPAAAIEAPAEQMPPLPVAPPAPARVSRSKAGAIRHPFADGPVPAFLLRPTRPARTIELTEDDVADDGGAPDETLAETVVPELEHEVTTLPPRDAAPLD
ncbi:MAG: DEAD/DEAH box helicase [Alphaproteobacteria bacterium]